MITPLRSFLLIKPDAVGRSEVLDRIHQLLRTLTSTASPPSRTVLSRRQIQLLWPQYFRNDCPVTAQFLFNYLSGRAIEVIGLEGPRAVDDARAVKREVRAQFATSPFSNCVHAPDDAQSALEQLAVLRGADLRVADLTNLPTFESPLESLSKISWNELQTATNEIWEEATVSGWASIWPASIELAQPEQEVFLVSDMQHTLDFAISGILSAVPEAGIKRAIGFALRTSLDGEASLCRASAARSDRVFTVITSAGLSARIGASERLPKMDRSVE
ncbi:hypothetical protein KJY99_11600 [Cutibacterium avidum]|nr:hypothetical protein [Cutibacterium avidum]